MACAVASTGDAASFSRVHWKASRHYAEVEVAHDSVWPVGMSVEQARHIPFAAVGRYYLSLRAGHWVVTRIETLMIT
jgi:hypothetical protein